MVKFTYLQVKINSPKYILVYVIIVGSRDADLHAENY